MIWLAGTAHSKRGRSMHIAPALDQPWVMALGLGWIGPHWSQCWGPVQQGTTRPLPALYATCVTGSSPHTACTSPGVGPAASTCCTWHMGLDWACRLHAAQGSSMGYMPHVVPCGLAPGCSPDPTLRPDQRLSSGPQGRMSLTPLIQWMFTVLIIWFICDWPDKNHHDVLFLAWTEAETILTQRVVCANLKFYCLQILVSMTLTLISKEDFGQEDSLQECSETVMTKGFIAGLQKAMLNVCPALDIMHFISGF